VAGVPAKRVGIPAHALPAPEMDQRIEQNGEKAKAAS
jgi:hypothetical protein